MHRILCPEKTLIYVTSKEMDVKFPSLFLAQCTLGSSEANMGKGKAMVVSDVALTSDNEVSRMGSCVAAGLVPAVSFPRRPHH